MVPCSAQSLVLVVRIHAPPPHRMLTSSENSPSMADPAAVAGMRARQRINRCELDQCGTDIAERDCIHRDI